MSSKTWAQLIARDWVDKNVPMHERMDHAKECADLERQIVTTLTSALDQWRGMVQGAVRTRGIDKEQTCLTRPTP